MAMKMPNVDQLHNAFASAENNLQTTPQGNGRYNMHAHSLKPRGNAPVNVSAPMPMGKPRSPLQVAAQKRAAAVSGAKRKGLGILG